MNINDIPQELIAKYFDVVYEFGVVTYHQCPAHSPHLKLHTTLAVKGADGGMQVHTVYGKDLIELCQHAVEFLEPRGWTGHSEQVKRGLIGAALAITNTIARGIKSGKVEIVS